MQRTTLSDYAAFYVRLLDGSDGYGLQFRWAIRAVEKWHGSTLYIDELTASVINEYLAATRETLSPQTRTSRRNMLLRLWRHAATNASLSTRPAAPNRDEIARVRKRQKSPQAWSQEEVKQLLATADQLTGQYRGGIDKRLYWRAYLLSAWSTGLRRCDLMDLQIDDIPSSGRVAILQQKTGRHVVSQFNQEALTAIRLLVGQHRKSRVFPLWCLLRCWRKIAKRIIRDAGIGGSIGRLRHSSGTAVEDANPGRGPQFLGNTPAVFYAHYYDRRQASDFPQPPPLRTS